MQERAHDDQPPQSEPIERPAAYTQWERATPPARRRPNQRTIVLAVAAAAIAAIIAIAIAHTPSSQGSTDGTGDPAPVAVDIPQFDQTGDPACAMHYSQNADGKTATRFTISQPGELITHVSGPDGLHRNDQQVTANHWAFTYDIPLNQITDMGAVLQYTDGSRAACSIGPGADAP